MEIKINVKLLNEQIQLLDTYASIITNKHYKGLVDGVIGLLDKICWALGEGEEICIDKVEEV